MLLQCYHSIVVQLVNEGLEALPVDVEPTSSVVAFARALYSTSVLDRETVGCFVAHHETRFDPKNTAKPPVERRSSTQPAKSASENALTVAEADFLILRPILIVF